MKKLVILRDKLELGEMFLRAPVLLVGRSPFCDILLRAPGVRSVHFIVEWVGEGDFKPEEGFWIVSAPTDAPEADEKEFAGQVHGHGQVIGPEGTVYEGFKFNWVEDRLSHEELETGMIKREVESKSGETPKIAADGFLLEVIRLSPSEDSVAHVEYISTRNAGASVFLNGPFGAKVQWSDSTAVLTWDESVAKVSSLGGVQAHGSKDLATSGLIKFAAEDQNYYLRLVPRLLIPKAPPEAEAERDSFFPFAATFALVMAIAVALFWQFAPPEKPEEVVPKLRIAKIEIRESKEPEPKAEPTPPPAATPEPAEAADKVVKAKERKTAAPPAPKNKENPKVVKQTPKARPAPAHAAEEQPPKAEPPPPAAAPPKTSAPNIADKAESKPSSQAEASGAASKAMRASSKPNDKAGINSPAPVKDVNTVGLLGSFKKSGQTPSKITADMIVNNGIATNAVTGASGKIILNQPASGVLADEKSAKGGESGRYDLAAASTTVAAGKAFDVSSNGPIARDDGLKGMNVGDGDAGNKPQTKRASLTDYKNAGLMGVSDKNAAKADRVSAEMIEHNGVAGGTAADGEAKVLLNEPSSGILRVGTKKSSAYGQGGKGALVGAASSVSDGGAFDVGNNGPVERKGGMSGYNVGGAGTGNASGSESRGNGESGESILGGLDRETVRRAIAAYRHNIRQCYDRELEGTPSLAGTVTFKWYISPQGQVTGAKVLASGLGSPRLEGCVLEVIRHITFPRSPNGEPTTVIYPFLFRND